MWNSFAKLERLNTALLHCEPDPRQLDIDRLFLKLRQRGMQDKDLNPIIWSFICALEPPQCQMGHCQYYGGQSSFCNCSSGRVPGRCKEHQDFLHRCEERKAGWIDRAMNEALCFYPEKVVGLVDWELIWREKNRFKPENAVRDMAAREGRSSQCEEAAKVKRVES